MKIKKSYKGAVVGLIFGISLFILVPLIGWTLVPPAGDYVIDYPGYIDYLSVGRNLSFVAALGVFAYISRKAQKFGGSRWLLVPELICLAIVLLSAYVFIVALLGSGAILDDARREYTIVSIAEVILVIWILTAYLLVLFAKPETPSSTSRA